MSVVKNVGLAKSKNLMVASRWLTAVNELHVCAFVSCTEPFSLTNRVSETAALMVWVDVITFAIKTFSLHKYHRWPNSLIRHSTSISRRCKAKVIFTTATKNKKRDFCRLRGRLQLKQTS